MEEKLALKPVMLVRPPLGILYDDGFWAELSEAGIEEVAIQWLALLDDRGGEGNRYPQVEDTNPRALAAVGGEPVTRVPVAAYRPNETLYDGLAIAPPGMPPHLEEESRKLRQTVAKASSEGFRVWVTDDKGYFLAGGFGDGRPRPSRVCTNDPELAGFAVTRTRDTLANFPSIHGIFLDGPDFKWEIKPGHRDDLFAETCGCRHCERVAESLGFSYERVLEGREAFGVRLRSLTSMSVEDLARHRRGPFGAFDWWTEEPAILDWMRYRFTSTERYLRAVCKGIKEYSPRLAIATSSRMPALAPLTGHNVRRKMVFNDYEMPKLYWWMGSVAGFRGTVANWVNTLIEWNPDLSAEDALRWFSAAFGVPFSDDYPPSAYEGEATDAFFDVTVDDQIQKMLAATGGPDRFMPWVGLEHFGSQWLTPSELRRLLERMKARGAQRYAYFVYNSITPEYWDVITAFSRE